MRVLLLLLLLLKRPLVQRVALSRVGLCQMVLQMIEMVPLLLLLLLFQVWVSSHVLTRLGSMLWMTLG